MIIHKKIPGAAQQMSPLAFYKKSIYYFFFVLFLFFSLFFCFLFMSTCGLPPCLASVNYCLTAPASSKASAPSKSGMT